MTALDATPSGIDLLAIQLGTTLARWGRERAARRAPQHDPVAVERLRAEVAAERARIDTHLMRIR